MATHRKQNKQLFDAVVRNDIVAATALLERGVDANSRSFRHWPVLFEAACRRFKAMVELLLCRGADVNESDHLGGTALMWVANWGFEEILDLLLQKSADVDKKSNGGYTAIHHASLCNPSMINRLLVCGATVDIEDNEGETPLWLAARDGYVKCVDFLLTVGANPHHRSKKDRSPLDIAKRNRHDEVVKKLNEAMKCRVLSLQFQIKRCLLKRYNRSQMMSFPLPTDLKEWLTEQLR